MANGKTPNKGPARDRYKNASRWITNKKIRGERHLRLVERIKARRIKVEEAKCERCSVPDENKADCRDHCGVGVQCKAMALKVDKVAA